MGTHTDGWAAAISAKCGDVGRSNAVAWIDHPSWTDDSPLSKEPPASKSGAGTPSICMNTERQSRRRRQAPARGANQRPMPPPLGPLICFILHLLPLK
jgi:hypothetical protein